jgi:hypothetical protein
MKPNERVAWWCLNISIILFIVGCSLPIIGNIVYYQGHEIWSNGYDQDDPDLKAAGTLRIMAGTTIKDMAAPLIFTGIGCVFIGILWARIPSSEKPLKCPECKKSIEPWQHFCSHCGLELEWVRPK